MDRTSAQRRFPLRATGLARRPPLIEHLSVLATVGPDRCEKRFAALAYGRRIHVVATTRSERVGPAARPVAVPDDVEDPSISKAADHITLPPHVRWSGRSDYNLADRQDRISVYEQVLTEGTADDVRYFIDVDQLVELWDELVLSPHVRAVWKDWLRARGRLAS